MDLEKGVRVRVTDGWAEGAEGLVDREDEAIAGNVVVFVQQVAGRGAVTAQADLVPGDYVTVPRSSVRRVP